jgi:hypothetical protein
VDSRRGRALLSQRLEELEALEPEVNSVFREWIERTITTVQQVLPEQHRAQGKITGVRWSPMVHPSSPESVRRSFESGRSQVAAVLKAAIFELEEFGEEGGSAGDVLAVHELKALERLITEIRRAEQTGEFDTLDPELRAEVAAETATLESQLRSPKPKRDIVRGALRSLRNITENALGGASGAGVVVAVKMAMDAIF